MNLFKVQNYFYPYRILDIGANVGLYSVYAAKSRNCNVFAFEPSVFNLELLARNIFINDLQLKITIIPIALSDKLGSNIFKMSSTSWGGALSTFGEDFDQNGNKFLDVFRKEKEAAGYRRCRTGP
jgi:FkbM family methyltransferase